VGADGVNGVTAKFSGFPSAALPAVALEAELAVPSGVHQAYAATALIDFGIVPGGYAWVFGKSEGVSVGIGKAPAAPGGNMHSTLQHFVHSVPGLDTGNTQLKHGYRIPLSGGRTFRRRGNVLLAGDAASLADLITGEGISYALASGRRAGATILAALAGAPEALQSYDAYLSRALEADRTAALVISKLMYDSPSMLFRLLERYDGARALLAGSVSGTVGYREVLIHLLKRLPAVVGNRLRG
jgi:flavin-dependent dehydrogenase